MKILLYFSAHVHLFRRSLPIGLDGRPAPATILRNGTTIVYRDPESPTYVISGGGGNEYRVELEGCINMAY